MKAKGKKSKNVEVHKEKDALNTIAHEAKSKAIMWKDEILQPDKGFYAVTPKKLSDSMERAAKEDKKIIKERNLIKSKKALDETINPKLPDHRTNRILARETAHVDPKSGKLKWGKEIGSDGFERATRHIQVTPGKWNTK